MTADWMSLTAAPTFAMMALLTAVFGGPPDMLCAAMLGTSPLSSMTAMYLLMSAFHLAPWLRLMRSFPLPEGERVASEASRVRGSRSFD
jgi:hypothetical protein